MKKLLLISAGIILFSCTKEKTITETQIPEKETVYIERPAEEQIETPPITEKEDSEENVGNTPENNDGLKDLSGKHALTLQWISWDRPGSINFKKIGENKYQVSGSQKNSLGYLKIEGVITQISNLNLAFEGTIETDIANNGGKCLRTGPETFLVTKNRKYWRLQNMEACFGLTDYVDIYF